MESYVLVRMLRGVGFAKYEEGLYLLIHSVNERTEGVDGGGGLQYGHDEAPVGWLLYNTTNDM
jgi:hypothetical protein